MNTNVPEFGQSDAQRADAFPASVRHKLAGIDALSRAIEQPYGTGPAPIKHPHPHSNAQSAAGQPDCVQFFPRRTIMAIKNIAIACQGGGSHAAYTAGALPVLLPRFDNVRIAQSGGRKSAMEEGSGERLNLAGISGTSGGAISALLAWFGYLTGGPQAAQERLDAFWDANCAHRPGERMLNEMTQWSGRVMSIDLKFSPYLPPLSDVERFASATWPLMTKMWPPFGHWIRDHYFQLRETVAPHVDFELVGAIGDFCSIPQDVKRWQSCELEARMLDAAQPGQAELHGKRLAIEEKIRSKLETTRRLVEWLARQNLAPDCLLRAAFDAWNVPQYSFESASLDRLAAAVQEVSFTIPQLLIGAVDIDSGAFIAFSSERSPDEAGVTLDAVAASACLPWVFKAQEIAGIDPDTQEVRNTACWDGLFSQNPPIKNFISNIGDPAKKPDGLWILQINQDKSDFSKRIADANDSYRYGSELWHRRDTLSGNLSLNQEIAFIEAVNRRLDDPDQAGRAQDKPVEVARIVMDAAAVSAAAGRDLGIFSKFDRHLALKNALVEHGRLQTTNFLTLRGDRDRLCSELAHALEQMGARPGRGQARAASWRSGHIFGGMLSPDVLTLDRAPGLHPDGVPQAALNWHVSDAVVGSRVVGIKGRTSLLTDGDGWRLGETRLLEVRQKDGAAAQLPAGAAAKEQAPRKPPPEGAERRHVVVGRSETLH
jgi:predicted acylesterase/phospholipase RssA